MDGLIIHISWEWALGIIGTLITLSYFAGNKFARLETSVDVLKDDIRSIKTSIENSLNPAFAPGSPVKLNDTGKRWVVETGLDAYVKKNAEALMQGCKMEGSNPYEVQQFAFRVFDEVVLDPSLEEKLKTFAYEHGTSLSVLRRVGGIYLRDIWLSKHNMNTDDIDKPQPKV